MDEQMSQGPWESLQEALNPHRSEQIAAVTNELSAQLRARGVRLTGTESSTDIANVLESVERFEAAVVANGGDLMMDEGPGGETLEPDDPRFVLPVRETGESVHAYMGRIDEASYRIRTARDD